MVEREKTQLIITPRETAYRRCVQSYLVIVTAGDRLRRVRTPKVDSCKLSSLKEVPVSI